MQIRQLELALAAFLLLPVTPAEAIPADPAVAFGVRPSIESIALSPDGRRLSYLQPSSGQGTALLSVDLAGSRRPRVAATSNGEELGLRNCRYSSNERLICTIHATRTVNGEMIPFSRLIAINDDGSDIRVLGERDSEDQLAVRGSSGSVIDYLQTDENAALIAQQFIPEGRKVTRTIRTAAGVGVVRVNTLGPVVNTIEQPRNDAVQYITDGRGNVRIMATRNIASPIVESRLVMQGDAGSETRVRGGNTIQGVSGASAGRISGRGTIASNAGRASDRMNFYYRRAGSRDWEPLGRYDLASESGFYPVAIDAALDMAYVFETLDGRKALYRVALDGSMRRERVATPDVIDVDGLIRIGRRNRIVGIRSAIDPEQTAYFDPEIRRLVAQLRQSLPNLPIIRFVDASEDEGKLLILASSESDPGSYYLLDRATNRLAEVLSARPELEGLQRGAVQRITYRAADGTMIPANLILPPGGAQRGLPAIVIPLSDGATRDQSGFDWLAQYFASRGYAVLQANFRGAARDSEAWFQENGFRAWRTAIGDVNDAGRWLISEGIADPARLAVIGWSYGGYAALQSGVIDSSLYRAIVAVAPVTDLAMLSRDWRDPSLNVVNVGSTNGFIGTGPHIAEGSPARNAAAIRAPVLLFHGALDSEVRVTQSRLMRDRLRSAGRQVELIEFPELDQQLEDSNARAQLLRRSDAFLRLALGS